MKKIIYACVHTYINNHTNIHMHLVKYLAIVSFDIFLIKAIWFSLCVYRCPSAWLCRPTSYDVVEHSHMSWWNPDQVNPLRSVQFCWITCLMLAVVLACSHSASYAWLNHPSRVISLDIALCKCGFPAFIE